MTSRLPRWVEYGAFVLALTAGCINAIGLLGVSHQALSHLSGTATSVGTSLAALDLSGALLLVGILGSFLLGAALSGFMLSGQSLELGRHYDSLLVIEGVLLLSAIYLLENGHFLGACLASAACGTQNALVTTYSGAIVRTTHVTGIFTDLGLMLGGALRGESFDRRKAILFLLIISGFVLGGAVGASLFAALHFMALAAPAITCLVLALSYRIYTVRARTQASDLGD
ncbi:YoaK family protein [Marinobacter sp. NFXS9]|uniref:YoaK family protein n=1 Tax=Marinobacter sp. NFXS9 TaxID=2818433 RepID=UPI0032DEBFE1